jgi:hypothetical protein
MNSFQMAALASLVLLAPAAVAQTTVDNAGSARNGKVGYWSSIVAQGGDVAISYYCEEDPPEYYTLRFAWAAGSTWYHTTIDYGAGSDTSMARAADGLYHIVYENSTGMGYAVGSQSTWSVGSVPTPAGVAPAQISMVLDSAGHPHVAYMNLANGGDRVLRYTRFDGQQWVTPGNNGLVTTAAWTPTIGFSNTYLALDPAGVPHIAFAQPADAINAFGPIKYATLQNNTWTIETLPVSGQDPSLAIGSDGVPRMMFDGANGIMYATKTGGTWQFETVVANASGSSIALTLDSANQPFASFGMTVNEDMYLASRVGGAWSISRIDGDGSSGPHVILGRYGTSIDVGDDGTPHVAYLNIDIFSQYTHRCDLMYYGPGGGTPACLVFTRPPAPQSVCPGGSANLSVQVAGSGPFSYQWQWQPSAGSWQAVTDGTNYDSLGQPVFDASGAALSSLTLTDLSGMLGRSTPIRCEASAACGSTFSTAAAFTVGAPLTITTQPHDATACASGAVSFSISSPDASTFQWQVFDGTGWVSLIDGLFDLNGAKSTVTGAATGSLTLGAASQGPGADPTLVPMTVRCVLAAPCGTGISGEASLTVSGPCCGSPDFNGDGDYGTDSDIEEFFACLAGDCCEECDPSGSDFNRDGDYGTDADIEAFFRVLAGGHC